MSVILAEAGSSGLRHAMRHSDTSSSIRFAHAWYIGGDGLLLLWPPPPPFDWFDPPFVPLLCGNRFKNKSYIF